jgi:hypothetical protein
LNPPDARYATSESKQALSINALGVVCVLENRVQKFENPEEFSDWGI